MVSHEFAIVIHKYSMLNDFNMRVYKQHTLLATHRFGSFTTDTAVVKMANHFKNQFLGKGSDRSDCVAYLPISAASLIEAFKHSGYAVNPNENPLMVER